MTAPTNPWDPDETKSFVHPILGEIIGWDNIDDFDAAIAAHNIAQGLTAEGMPIKEEP